VIEYFDLYDTGIGDLNPLYVAVSWTLTPGLAG
jgi:hypothetical protein